MRVKLILSFIFIISCSVLTHAQNIPIRTEWNPKDLETKVSINDLILLDNVDNALKLNVSFTYPDRKLLKSPESISLQFRYFSPEPKYLNENNRGLAIIADGEGINLGILNQTTYRADVNGRKVTGYIISYPKADTTPILDISGKRIGKAFLELLSTEIGLQKFLKIARANRIEFMLGNDVYSFSETQIRAIRNLANRTTP